MLPKRHRYSLRQHPDFGKRSVQYHSPTLQISYQTDQEIFQAAVVVPKKTAALAVNRNRIKRQVSQVLQELLPLSPTLAKLQLVMRIKKTFLDQSFIKNELEVFLAKISRS